MKMTRVLFLVLALCVCVSKQVDNPRDILDKLANDFRYLPERRQYGVLYVPPPNAPRGQVWYIPRRPDVSSNEGPVTYPGLTQEMINTNRFPYTYVATTPDYGGAMSSQHFGRTAGRTVHTEDLGLNIVLPYLTNWYNNQYSSQPRRLFLYTFYLPCPNCAEIIQQFMNDNPRVQIFVGYTELYGGNRERNNETARLATRNRRNQLQNLLNNNNGGLMQVGGMCSIINRMKRDTSSDPVCFSEPSNTELVLAMDFSTGNAIVWFRGLPPFYYGAIVLYDCGVYVDSKWANSATGMYDFGVKMKAGMHAAFSSNYYSIPQSNIIGTPVWDYSCGMDWTELNNLPRSYGDMSIALYVRSGAPFVCLKKSHGWHYGSYNSYDWVMIQGISQIASDPSVTSNRHSYDWVTNFETINDNVKCLQFPLVTTSLANGFRAKYVYYRNGYQYRGPYDNSSPFWTPEECIGARGIPTRGYTEPANCVSETAPPTHDELKRK